jgi:hypothetical protein
MVNNVTRRGERPLLAALRSAADTACQIKFRHLRLI